MFGKIKQWIYNHTEFGRTRYLNYLYKYDMDMYFHNSCMNVENKENLATSIRLIAHAIEKGMSLPHCKKGFGKEKIKELMTLCDKYEQVNNRKDSQALQVAAETIAAYVQFQEKRGEIIDFVPEKYRENKKGIAGIKSYVSKIGTNFEEIAHNRHSSRNFSNRIPDQDLIKKIVTLAQTAPSACNRQPVRVFACVDYNKRQKIMQMHGGVKGFGMPGVIFAITGDLGLYQGEFERNTVFVDAGIFAMNMLYALDCYGLVACPVIWGSEPDMDSKISDILNIPKAHKIVILIMAGYYPGEQYIAACSPKRDVDSILKII